MKDLAIQIILYSKNHYKKSNSITDLATIIEYWNGGCKPRKEDIWVLLVSVSFRYLEPREMEKYLLSSFNGQNYSGNVIFDVLSRREPIDLTFENAVDKLLGLLSITKVSELRNKDLILSAPDANILPLREIKNKE